MGYWGSVKFFRHLILVTLLMTTVILCSLCLNLIFKKDIIMVKSTSNIKKTAENSVSIKQTRPSESENAVKQPQSLFVYKNKYKELYAEPVEEKELINGNIYLTFDDGPSRYTSAFLDILKKHQVHATFFVVGTNVEKNFDIVRRMHKEGHVIAVHTYSHRYRDIYSDVDSYLSDFKKTDDAICKVTGKRSTIFRFPGGSINIFNYRIYTELSAEMLRRGYRYFDWNISAGDATKKITRASIVTNVVDNVGRDRPNIVLMHDTSELSLQSLEKIIVSLKMKNYVFSTLQKNSRPLTFTR